ncbi:hypothetical protein BIY23_04660 [Wolbachia pipientis]|uniref:Uncharacterized protein n=1 Tax=Wolbachia pipientis TaxID=955 RepID=A0A1E7QK42_WOLPI|nr:hypothetical protein [Wolbachia pipientis]OEY86842.1 hypothetical protein BIY23_04660 [Wolbachia pipientis]
MCNSHSTVHIDCNNHANITVTCNENVTIRNKREVEIEICQLNGSIKFTLESKDDKNIAYTDGKLSFAIPKELKNYKVGGKNLFDIIREYFQKLCEKLGFNFEEKIEYHFDALSAAGYLESVEPLINFINIQPPRNI